MWIMTPFGILMPSARPAHTIEDGDPKTLQIRTRRKIDLEILKREYMGDDLGEITHTPLMDYNYRAYCTPEAFGKATAAMIANIDYEKFKPTTETLYGDKDLHSVYNSIWGTVTRLGRPWEGRPLVSYSGSWKASKGKSKRRNKKTGIYDEYPSMTAYWEDKGYVDTEWIGGGYTHSAKGSRAWWNEDDAEELYPAETYELPKDMEDAEALWDTLTQGEKAEILDALYGPTEGAVKSEQDQREELEWDAGNPEDWDEFETSRDTRKSSHRTKRGKKKAQRAQVPEFSG